MDASLCLVLFRHRASDIGGREDGEDERLKDRNEDLEAHEENREWERDPRQDPGLRTVLQEEDRPQEEDRQQEMARQEVRGETDGQRDRPDEDRGDKIDQRQQRVPKPPRRLGDDADEPQIPEETVACDADGVVRHPRDDREYQRNRDPAVRGEAQAGDHLEHVPEEDEEEERREKREVSVGLLPQHGHRDLLADEPDPDLHHRLKPPRHDLRLSEGEVEEQHEDHRRERNQEDNEVEAQVEAEEVEGPAPTAVHEVSRGRWLEGGGEDPETRGHPVSSRKYQRS